MKPTMKMTVIASSVMVALATVNAQAGLVFTGITPACNTLDPCPSWSTDSANFTMLAPNGGMVGGTNDVHMAWDSYAYTASSDYTGPGTVAADVTMSSATPFFGFGWTAHNIQMFVPGSYSFNVALGGGNPETGTLSATVPTGDLGMHMLFDWNGNNNIDVFVVFALNNVFGSGLLYSTVTNSKGQLTCDASYTGTITKNCLYDGPNYGSTGHPVKNQKWLLASTVNTNSVNGVAGIPMAAGGPFAGFNFNISAFAPVPIPAAIWLFGSGLLALVGVGRRRKRLT